MKKIFLLALMLLGAWVCRAQYDFTITDTGSWGGFRGFLSFNRCADDTTCVYLAKAYTITEEGDDSLIVCIKADMPGYLSFGEGEQSILYRIVGIADSVFANVDFGRQPVTLPSYLEWIGYRAFDSARIALLRLPATLRRVDDIAFWDAHVGTTSFMGSVEQWCDIDFASSMSNPVIMSRNLLFDTVELRSFVMSPNTRYLKPYVFNGDELLENVVFSDSLRVVGAFAFKECSSLDSIVIPAMVDTLGDKCFMGCRRLKYFHMEAHNCRYAGSRAGFSIFANCDSLTTVTLGKHVTRIPPYMFMYTHIENIFLPNSVTHIGDDAFAQCDRLKTVRLGEELLSVGGRAFADCPSLDSVTFYSINCMQTGGADNAPFLRDSSVTKLVIGPNVEFIPNVMFRYMTHVTHIISRAVEPPYVPAPVALEDIPDNAMVTVPCGSEDAYRTELGWSRFRVWRTGAVFAFDISTNDSTLGTVDITRRPTCDYLYGEFTAVPAANAHFVKWSDEVYDIHRRVEVVGDTAITAIFAEGVGLTTCEGNPVRIYAEGNTIVVEGDAEMPVMICDVMGRVVVNTRGQGTDRYRMTNNGIYIVRVGGSMGKKVLVSGR